MINQNEPNKKNNKTLIIVIICILFFAILGVILFFVLNSSNSSKYKFEGNWTCTGDIKLKLDSKNFYYDAKTIIVDATYEIEYDEFSESPIGNYYKYGLIVKTTNRIINGEKDTEPYSTKYEIDIEAGNEDELLMINSATYNMYQCHREK